jgi:pimeloyl-ACP methyl ester carboxylesterase
MVGRVILIRHERVSLALHELRPGAGKPLLLLHALGGSAGEWSRMPSDWPGPVYALDFSGHGDSARVAGGAYTPELLVGDADAALARLGTACLAGAGLGAWVALLLAGARPDHVPAALLLPGAGLAGGGAVPDFQAPVNAEWVERTDVRLRRGGEGTGGDPHLLLLAHDLRPVDYAEAFAARARRLLFGEDGDPRPPWWEAAAKRASVERVPASDLRVALALLASGA